MARPRIFVLDEKFNFKEDKPEWKNLKRNTELIILNELPNDPTEIRNKLNLADCILVNSTVTALSAELIDNLSYLDFIICPENYKSAVDLTVCQRKGIRVELIKQETIGTDSVEVIEEWLAEQLNIDPKVTEKFHQNPAEIYQILIDKKVEYLYHANTLSTSQTFIEEGSLLSRGFVEKNGLLQTDQSSDNLDKKYGIWDDVFLDGIDIHSQHMKPNKYGPILFLLKPELLLELKHPLLITRINPIYWEQGTSTWRGRYLLGSKKLVQEYKDYTNTSSRMMLTVKNCDVHINLTKYLVKIIIDQSEVKISSLPMATFLEKALRQTLDKNGLNDIPILFRHSKNDMCKCIGLYNELAREEKEEFKKRVRPKK